jgi:predicted HD phosphohydrolase
MIIKNDPSHVVIAKYNTMDEGTREEYHACVELSKPFKSKLADRLLDAVTALKKSYPGEQVDRYVHSLQSATRAHRDGQDEEMVVAALLHDIGDMHCPENHAEFSASVLRPYVSPSTHWVILRHGLFQGYYYFHHFDLDRNARDKFRGHPDYERCADFCGKYDQMAFDPNFDTMPLSAFEPMVRRIFAREPWGGQTKMDVALARAYA